MLRQRRAPHRPRLRGGHRRRRGPLAPAPGRRRALRHRHRRVRAEEQAGGRGPGPRPPGAGRPQQRPLPGGGRPARRRLRRLHPHHRAPPHQGGAEVPAGRLRQRRHRARHLRGPLLRELRGLLHRGRAGRRQLPGPRPPGGAGARRRTGSSGSPATSSGCSTGTTSTPTPSSPPAGATRCCRSSAPACATSPSAAAPSGGACPCRGTPSSVAWVWFDALPNYITAAGYGADDPSEFELLVAGRLPPHRQGHHPLPRRLLAGDAAWPPAWSRPGGWPPTAGCC